MEELLKTQVLSSLRIAAVRTAAMHPENHPSFKRYSIIEEPVVR